MYRRRDENTFEKLEVTEVMNLSKVKAKLKRLREELDAPEPTDEELIEEGRAVHPYYENRERCAEEVIALEKLIAELELL